MDEDGETICGWLSLMTSGSKAKNYRAIFEMCRKYECRYLAEIVFASWHEQDVVASSCALFSLAYECGDETLARKAMKKSVILVSETNGGLKFYMSCLTPSRFDQEYLGRLTGEAIGKLSRYLLEHHLYNTHVQTYIGDPMLCDWVQNFAL